MNRSPCPSPRYAAVGEIAAQLHEDRSKSSLNHADQLVDKIEALKNKASSLPSKPFEEIRETVSSWRDAMDIALRDCNAGLIATGDMALCARWWNPKVEPKLKALDEEFKKVESALTSIQLESFRELGGRMAVALKIIKPTVKNLSCLPDRVGDIANSVGKELTSESTTDSNHTSCQSQKSQESTDRLRHLLARLQHHLDCPGARIIKQAEINKSLHDLERCLAQLPVLVNMTQSSFRIVTDFFNEAADRIKDVFLVPSPCGCMSGYVMDQPHWAVWQLFKHTAKAQNDLSDFAQFGSLLHGLKLTLINLDVTKIGAPVKQFSLLASERLAQLDKAVDEATPA